MLWCQTVSQTGGSHARDSHTFYYVSRPSVHFQETPRQSVTVPDSLSLCRRLFLNLLLVPRRSLHHRRLSVSLMQMPRWSGRLSDTIWESPACALTVFAPSGSLLLMPRRSCILSGTVCESPSGAQTVFPPSQTVWESLGTGFGSQQSVKRRAVVV
ncbi:hypothetical protein DPMN_151012 [Dreissena polymorpha]|uniref:Uncharacterized protein n=1 Tax=Dreissena polymorpha TaxID=45954 RepID=A0A9D4FGC8_DREPO|nr:hypothetical protein DPMN_151012 [Dreissena polymorpha]